MQTKSKKKTTRKKPQSTGLDEVIKKGLSLEGINFDVDPLVIEEEIISVPTEYATLVTRYHVIIDALAKAETSLNKVELAADATIRDKYVQAGAKKPAEDKIKLMVKADPMVLNYSEMCSKLKVAKEVVNLRLRCMELKDRSVARVVTMQSDEVRLTRN